MATASRVLAAAGALALGILPIVSTRPREALAASRGLAFQALDGRAVPVAEPSARATFLVFLSTECPLSNRYGPAVRTWQREYAPRGVRFLAVYPNNHETNAAVKTSAAARRYTFAAVRDRDGRASAALGATVTPEVAVLDAAGRPRYLGPLDGVPAQGTSRRSDLRRVLDAVLAGQKPRFTRVAGFGCLIERPARVTSSAVVYAGQIQPILRARCEPCHHKGEAAPFSLEGYGQAKAWAATIKLVTQSHRMPPWQPAPGRAFHNERHLSPHERDLIARWADAGAPLGSRAALMKPAAWPRGWLEGTPDLVVRQPAPFTLGGDGPDVYRCYSIPMEGTADRWIQAIEVMPGNRAVVHHVLLFVDPEAKSRALDDADPGPGYASSGGGVGVDNAELIGGWAPGVSPQRLPAGVAQRLPAGARLILQVHYHRNGQTEVDQTRIGLHWAKGPVDKAVRIAWVLNTGFTLPPGERAVPVQAALDLPEDVTVLGVVPHMHLLGKTIRARALLPGGRSEDLITVPRWDFNWQDFYWYKEPVKLPAGSRVVLDAVYDNSADNPNNPNNPPREVRWGEQTTDEMCLLFVVFTRDVEHMAAATS